MVSFTNNHNISLAMAVWLLHDEYDYVDDPKHISATTLLKPLKQIILSRRVDRKAIQYDVSDFIASSFGTAVHDSLEKAWVKAGVSIMRKLGYPEHICERIRINPSDDDLKADPNIISVWIEKRAVKEIGGWKVGGKFDIVINGRLHDNKTTSVYAYLLGNRDQQYREQGSIYRWLHPDKITEDHIYIQFVFTDWQKMMAKRDPKYPQLKLLEHKVSLMTPEDTEDFIREKLRLLDKYIDAPEADIPECTDEDLWRSAPQHKYYADANKTDGRSTKNFTDLKEAKDFMASKGNKGVIKTTPGEVKACAYCKGFDACKQKDRYV